MLKKEVNVNVSKKITSYRLHMTGITQNKQKCLIFIVLPWSRKNLIRSEGYSTSKKSGSRINNNKKNDKYDNNDNSNISNNVKTQSY